MKKKARVNPVAKHAHRFNRAATHVDRKKEQKKQGPSVPKGGSNDY